MWLWFCGNPAVIDRIYYQDIQCNPISKSALSLYPGNEKQESNHEDYQEKSPITEGS
jgi:hypothetical protein